MVGNPEVDRNVSPPRVGSRIVGRPEARYVVEF